MKTERPFGRAEKLLPCVAVVVVRPTGLEPASTRTQAAESARDSEREPSTNSTYYSTLVAGLATAVREAIAAGATTLPRSLRTDIARLLAEGS